MPSPHHPAAVFAAAASAAAGLIHAAAAGSHAELSTLSTLFALAAIAQVGWAGAALVRPGRSTALAGMAVNLVALNAWVVTRGTGISFVDGLEEAQSVGLQDGMAASLAVLAAVGAALSLSAESSSRFARVVAPAAAAALVALAVPAMAEPHDHASHDHPAELAHDDGHAHAETAAASGHDHADPGQHADGDAHDADSAGHRDQAAADGPTSAELGYPASFAAFLDGAPSAAARSRAETLLLETTEAMKAFPDEASLQAAGFTSIGDAVTGYEHYIHVGRIIDPAVLDPDGIESVVLRVQPDGTKEVASAMYLLPFGATMDDVPDIAGDLTQWHDHQNLCWDGVRVVGITADDGSCRRGTFRATQPMLHVWVTDHPCGPFAGIEGSHGSGCSHEHEG